MLCWLVSCSLVGTFFRAGVVKILFAKFLCSSLVEYTLYNALYLSLIIRRTMYEIYVYFKCANGMYICR